MIQPTEWRFSATIVGLVKYLKFYSCDFKLLEDCSSKPSEAIKGFDGVLYYSEDITKERSANIKNYEYEVENDFLNSTMQNWLDSNLEIQLNSLQKFCLANTNSNIVITAPTGMEKTEAGLFWCGNHKCFLFFQLKLLLTLCMKEL